MTNRTTRRDFFRKLSGQGNAKRPEAQWSGLDPDVRQADALLKEGRYDDAIAMYNVCIAREPIHLEAFRKKGYCQFRAGYHEQARETWDRFLEDHPEDAFVLLYSGLSHAAEGSVEGALVYWRRYRDYRNVGVQRELNLILAEHERGDTLDSVDLVARIERVIGF